MKLRKQSFSPELMPVMKQLRDDIPPVCWA
jgi:hypothetical protein